MPPEYLTVNIRDTALDALILALDSRIVVLRNEIRDLDQLRNHVADQSALAGLSLKVPDGSLLKVPGVSEVPDVSDKNY